MSRSQSKVKPREMSLIFAVVCINETFANSKKKKLLGEREAQHIFQKNSSTGKIKIGV